MTGGWSPIFRKKKCRAILEDALFFGSGHCVSDHDSKTAAADFGGLQLYTVQMFLELSCCSFDAGEKDQSIKKKNDKRKRMTWYCTVRSPASENCA